MIQSSPFSSFTPEKLAGLNILIIGDTMIDRFIYGEAERLSPEAPVPVFRPGRKTETPGGAGNVFTNLGGLGVPSILLTLTGDDEAAEALAGMCKKWPGGKLNALKDSRRSTTVKTRYVAGQQQIMRVDEEEISPLSAELERELLNSAETAMQNCNLVVFSDYKKGVFGNDVTRKLIALAKTKNIPVLVDSKETDPEKFAGADYFTPNRTELAAIAGKSKVVSDQEIEEAATRVQQKYNIGTIIATRSEDGLSVITKGKNACHIKHKELDVFDVSGAGDTVVAVLAATLAAGLPIKDCAGLANKAGGIVVGRKGTSILSYDDLFHDNAAATAGGFIREWEEARAAIKGWQETGLKVGLTNGCFDVIHYGHVKYLQDAKDQCDKLVVALNTDSSVRLLKGLSRPVNGEEARGAVMAALQMVDLVVLFGADNKDEDNTPAAVIDALQPDIFMKGGDYKPETLPESKNVYAYGGVIHILPFYDGYSTTGILAKGGGGK